MAENIWLWSITASSNDTADPAVPWPENMLPGAVNNAARSTMAAVARFRDDINGTLATTGSSNAYLVTTNSGVTAFTNGQLVTARANFSNTGACTLNMNSLGAKAIRVFDSSGEIDPVSGQIQNGGTYQFRYDTALNSSAGAWLLLNPSAASKIGTIEIWSTDTAPTNYLFCNGAAVSRTTYASLFALLSTTYGSGDSSTTFNLPDLRGRAPFGSDDMGTSAASRITNAGSGIVGTTLAASGGAETVTLTTAQLASHTHTGTTASSGSHGHGFATSTDGTHHHTGSTDNDGTGAHTHTVTINQANAAAAAGFSPLQIGSGTNITTSSNGAHVHNFTTTDNGAHFHSISADGSHTHTFTSDASGSGNAHNNMPPALIVNFVIKAL
jgi:microcystin-dependent protein